METIAVVSLIVAFVCAAIIVADEMRRPQTMWIMNFVWPATALYLSVFALWGYFRFGRAAKRSEPGVQHHSMHHDPTGQGSRSPSAVQVALATSHCGAGCALGDIAAEYAVGAFGLTLFGSALLASYAVDFAAAWALGIAFQYFTIKPMKNVSAMEALREAIKIDTLSIAAFQVGMYSWMALTHFVIYPHPHLEPSQALFWLMMQIAMILGFATSYPMNRWLIIRGVKEAMG
jgi:hypothetical protein